MQSDIDEKISQVVKFVELQRSSKPSAKSSTSPIQKCKSNTATTSQAGIVPQHPPQIQEEISQQPVDMSVENSAQPSTISDILPAVQEVVTNQVSP